MRSGRPELIKQTRDVLDEIIPAMPVDERTSALVARIGESILKSRCRRAGELRDSIGGRLSRNGHDLERENKPIFYLTEEGPGKAFKNVRSSAP
jgi:hypothetical protein